MKIQHLVFHPNLQASRVNQRWRDQLVESGTLALSRDMYADYPDFQIDVEREQALLMEHDRIVLQFPFYWYSSPPLLKKWLDDVLTYGFAYGSTGTALHGKDLQLIVSVGGQPQYYSGFDIFATVHELLRPFQLTANLCGMNYAIPQWMFRADSAEDAEVSRYGEKWIDLIDDPSRSDPRAVLRAAGLDDLDMVS